MSKKEDLIATLSSLEVSRGEPGGERLMWDACAVRWWLEEQGFDLEKEIIRTVDPLTNNIIFRQDT